MKGHFREKISQLLFSVSIIFLLIVFVLEINGGIGAPACLAVSFAIILAIVILLFRKKNKQIQISKKVKKVLLIIFVIIAIFARAAPLFIGMNHLCENNLSDTGIHYFGAQELAKGRLEKRILGYDAMYPYLLPYTVILSVFTSILGINTAIVVSNIIFDAMGCLFVYLILKKIGASAKTGALLWAINPFSIIMCWLPLNIVCVNMLLAIIVYISICLYLECDYKKKVSLSLLLGLSVFLGNLFRPIFIVVPIALTIIMLISKKVNLKNFFCFVVIFISVAVPTQICSYVAKTMANGDDIFGSSGGWSFYVGSNYESKGQWTREDSNYFFGTVKKKSQTISEAQNTIKKEGMKRYSEMGMIKIANHIANKMSVMFSDVGDAIHDICYEFGINDGSFLYIALKSIVGAYFMFLSFCSLLYIYESQIDKERSSNKDVSLLILLIFMGLCAGFLLVEVMNRYSSVFFVLTIILTAMFLSKKSEHQVS